MNGTFLSDFIMITSFKPIVFIVILLGIFFGINRLENILTELKKENKTVVTITHDMEFAVNNFKKIFVMSHKNLLRVGNAKEIFSDDELLKDSMLKKTYIGDLCDRLNLNETAVTIEEFLKYFV